MYSDRPEKSDFCPYIVLGLLDAVIMGGIEGAVVIGGLSALSAGLVSIGIPRNTAIDYEKAIKADGFVVLMQGTHEETEHARTILRKIQAKQMDIPTGYRVGKLIFTK